MPTNLKAKELEYAPYDTIMTHYEKYCALIAVDAYQHLSYAINALMHY